MYAREKMCIKMIVDSSFFKSKCKLRLKRDFLEINPFQNKPWFLRVSSTSLLKTLWEKEKLLVTSIFFLFPQCFLPIWRTPYHFHQT